MEAITRIEIANYVNVLIWIYSILILVRILLSWLPRLPDIPTVRGLVQFICDLTDPYLNIFRRILPPIGGSGFGLDLSPMVALIVLVLVGRLLTNLIAG